ncbi:MAG: YihY/virulence factor BrkB family protein [Phycisphaerae bacterium]|nr:YihY/virulence factor BrkB family protein [Phycisphaerae bacterium]
MKYFEKIMQIASTPSEQLGRASRFLAFQIRLWPQCVRLLIKNRANQAAAALAYYTIFGIVPLAIVALLIFQSLPGSDDIGKKLKNGVYDYLNLSTIQLPTATEGEEQLSITSKIDEIVSEFFVKAEGKGAVTIVNILLVIYAATVLLSTIETSFNNIWHVAKGRPFLNRIINYWALLTLGPILLGAGIYVTAQVTILQQFKALNFAYVDADANHSDPLENTGYVADEDANHSDPLGNTGYVVDVNGDQEGSLGIGAKAFNYLLSTIFFSLLYFVLPNAKVNFKAAFWGAAIAALVWSLAKWLFSLYVTKFIPYNELYGTLGLIPLSVFWIFVTWLIVLFGLQITYTTQHLDTLDAARLAATKKSENYFVANDMTAINIAREIAIAFEKKKAPVAGELVANKLGLPAEFAEKMYNHLIRGNILIRASEPVPGLVPATDPENIKLSDIIHAVSEAGFAQGSFEKSPSIEKITDMYKQNFEQFTLKQVLDL